MKIKKNVLIRERVEGTYTWEVFFFKPKELFSFARLVCSHEFIAKSECKEDMEASLKALGIDLH